jgi:hypothetical protein
MGVPTSEVGYTSATTGRGDNEVRKGYVVALAKKNVEGNSSRKQDYVLLSLFCKIQSFRAT